MIYGPNNKLSNELKCVLGLLSEDDFGAKISELDKVIRNLRHNESSDYVLAVLPSDPFEFFHMAILLCCKISHIGSFSLYKVICLVLLQQFYTFVVPNLGEKPWTILSRI
ncbi:MULTISPECIES: hypothetical protein [unclassified Wolbachia]|uniref:hypothetical protein n=1 Tax=unclassified Wolbachia TaxID=2640676 RepID=UPI0031331F5C